MYICGSYGSGPMMNVEERKRVAEMCVKILGGAIKVVAHTGTANTRDTVELTKHAETIGCDAAAAVGPYYFHIVNEQANVLGKATKQVGVRNTAIQGSNEVLKQGLKETLFQALQHAGLALQDIEFVISSGMITSEIGLLETPHLWAPTSLDELAGSLKHVHDLAVFPVNLPIYVVRGIKNPYDPLRASMKDVGLVDFMRGEEAQVAGRFS